LPQTESWWSIHVWDERVWGRTVWGRLVWGGGVREIMPQTLLPQTNLSGTLGGVRALRKKNISLYLCRYVGYRK
jgi:hypothetical protein